MWILNFTASTGQNTKMKTLSLVERKRGHHFGNLYQPNTHFEQHTLRALQPDRDGTVTAHYNRHPTKITHTCHHRTRRNSEYKRNQIDRKQTRPDALIPPFPQQIRIIVYHLRLFWRQPPHPLPPSLTYMAKRPQPTQERNPRPW